VAAVPRTRVTRRRQKLRAAMHAAADLTASVLRGTRRPVATVRTASVALCPSVAI
jgi:hypothetical protein